MLDINILRSHKDEVIKGLEKKYFANASETVQKVLDLDESRKQTQKTRDDKQSEANTMAKEIGVLMRNGEVEKANHNKEEAKKLGEEAKVLQDELAVIKSQLDNLLVLLPNIPHPSVPNGKTEDDNEIIFTMDPIDLGKDALPHWDLIKQYDIVDFELGNKITGAGFPVYKGAGAKIQRALISFFLDEAEKAGYLEVQPPILINKESGYGTGQLPDKDGQMYHAVKDDLYLIPTAEVPITNMYRDEIVKLDELPIKNVGYSPCFRREAGSWGAHVRGLNRLHQFDKVEIVQIQHPDKSYEALEGMMDHVKSLLEKLELPYRILRLCGGDISFTAALTYDFEVYSAAQKRWLEVSSVSNFETYQSNRLKLRYRGKDKKTHLLHTLNGSALALPRILASILENNQSVDGISIPEVLRPYTKFDVISN